MNNRKAPSSLAFRGMADAREDYARLKTWLCNPAVRKWYGADDFPVPPSLEDVVKKYRVPSLLEEEVHPCFILADGTPVGYIQFYPIRDHGDGVWGDRSAHRGGSIPGQGHRHPRTAGHDPFSV